jgi:putative restriction endonuclease
MDANEQLGQPIVTNGLPLSRIHHAAFDAGLIAIDPDFRIMSQRVCSKCTTGLSSNWG